MQLQAQVYQELKLLTYNLPTIMHEKVKVVTVLNIELPRTRVSVIYKISVWVQTWHSASWFGKTSTTVFKQVLANNEYFTTITNELCYLIDLTEVPRSLFIYVATECTKTTQTNHYKRVSCNSTHNLSTRDATIRFQARYYLSPWKIP